MEKKKFSIELPKGGMSNLAKQTVSKPHQEPSVNATEWQRFTHYLDEFKNVSEHGATLHSGAELRVGYIVNDTSDFVALDIIPADYRITHNDTPRHRG